MHIYILIISFALTSVVVYLAITTSPFRLVDFSHSLPNKLSWGLTLLFLSVFIMMRLELQSSSWYIRGKSGKKLSYIPSLSCQSGSLHFLEKAWHVILLSRPRETKFYTRTANPSNHQSTMSVWECYNDRLLESLVAYKNFLLDKNVRASASSLFFFFFLF